MINERLKAVRQHLNMSQADFAESIGLKQGSYSDIESGKKGAITKQTEMLLVAIHHVNMDFLDSGKGPMFKTDSQSQKNGGIINNHIEGIMSHPIISHIGDGDSPTISGFVVDTKSAAKDIRKQRESNEEIARQKDVIIRLEEQIKFMNKLIEEKDKIIAEKERFIQLILNKL